MSIESRGGWPEQRPAAANEIERLWEPCRNYLLLVANRELNAELRAKVSPSDVVQETFLEAQKHFDQFRGTSRQELLAWLSSILQSLLRNASRRYQETQRRDVSREVPFNGHDSWQFELPSGEPTPCTNSIARENSRNIYQAMSQLSGEYRRVIELRSWKGLSFADVGKQMNRSAEAARKLWGRAVERLGDLVESQHEGD